MLLCNILYRNGISKCLKPFKLIKHTCVSVEMLCSEINRAENTAHPVARQMKVGVMLRNVVCVFEMRK